MEPENNNLRLSRINDVLVSFDGSTPHCIEKLKRSINEMTDEAEGAQNRSKSRSRAHPKVNLPFYRHKERQKPSARRNTPSRFNESVNEGSTQETESSKRVPEAHQSFKRELTAHLNGKLDGYGTLNPLSQNNQFIFVNNLDCLEDGRIQSESTKRNLMRNFNHPHLSANNSKRALKVEQKEDGTNKYISSMKKNVQKFLIPQSAFANENLVKRPFVESARVSPNQTRGSSISAKKVRHGSMLNGNSSNLNIQGLERVKRKLRIQTKFIDNDASNALEDSLYRERHNYSVANSPTYDLIRDTPSGESEKPNTNRTLESGGIPTQSARLKLPSLKLRNRRRAARYSNSSARKKLPECFLMNNDGRNSSRRSIKMQYLMNCSSSKKENLKARKMESFKISNITEQQKEALLGVPTSKKKGNFQLKDWNNSSRFTPIIHN